MQVAREGSDGVVSGRRNVAYGELVGLVDVEDYGVCGRRRRSRGNGSGRDKEFDCVVAVDFDGPVSRVCACACAR